MKSSAPRPVAFVLVSTEQGTMLVNRHDYRLTTQTTGYGVCPGGPPRTHCIRAGRLAVLWAPGTRAYAGAGCHPASAHSWPLTAELLIIKQIASAISSGRIRRPSCV